jgi:hypothetical protein
MLGPEHATEHVRNNIRHRFAEMLDKAGKPRLLEKSPSNALRPAFVQRVFPDAKFIHVTRHGLDSVLSLQAMTQQHAHGLSGLAPNRLRERLAELEWTRLHHYAMEFARRAAPGPLRRLLGPNPWGPRVPGIRAMMREMHPLEVAAIQWRMCVETTHAFGKTQPADRFFEFRLDDMSESVLHDLLAFAELENNQPVLDHFAKTFKPSYAGRQRLDAKAEDIRRVMSLIEPTLQWLGYSTQVDTAEAS